MRVQRPLSTFALAVAAQLLAPVAGAGVITIAPGASPAGGYLPLSAFGIAPIAGVGDETISNFNVPSFSYAGQSWTALGIVSNGYVVVGGGTNADIGFVNLALPSASAPANILAPFWTDLNPAFGGAIRAGVLTVGAQDISRTVGATYYYNGSGVLPTEGTQLRVTTRDLPVDVPEPGTVALLGLALAGLGVSRRRSTG